MSFWSRNYTLKHTITSTMKRGTYTTTGQDRVKTVLQRNKLYPEHQTILTKQGKDSIATKQTLPWISDNAVSFTACTTVQISHAQLIWATPVYYYRRWNFGSCYQSIAWFPRTSHVRVVCGSCILWTVCWEAAQNKHIITRRTISVNTDSSSIRRILLPRILHQNLTLRWNGMRIYEWQSIWLCCKNVFTIQ
jgi:hypothetical protein